MVYYQQQDADTQDAFFFYVRCLCASYEGLPWIGGTILTSALCGVQQRDSAPHKYPLNRRLGGPPELILEIPQHKKFLSPAEN